MAVTWWKRASRITGATTRLATSRRSAAIHHLVSRVSRWRSSKAWSRRSMLQGSRSSWTLSTTGGNHLGPTLCFRGIDNRIYYNLVDGDLRYYTDFTGTGNTLNVGHSQTLKLIADSLRMWVQEYHV